MLRNLSKNPSVRRILWGSNVRSVSRAFSASTNAEQKDDHQELREDLAAAYRIADMMGWGDLIYNHISVRLPGTDHFLLNPYGLGYDEVTASSLVTIDIEGNIVDKGNSTGIVNKAGFIVHSSVHKARSDAHAVVHMHHPAVMAVSAMKCGFLPISQDSLIIGRVGYHKYEGIAIMKEEQESLAQDLGPDNMALILQNHGGLTLGSSLYEAFIYTYFLNKACEAQCKAIAGSTTPEAVKELLIFPDHEVQERTIYQARNFNPHPGKLEFRYLKRKLDRVDTSYKL